MRSPLTFSTDAISSLTDIPPARHFTPKNAFLKKVLVIIP
jgi:hypothetical protein